MSTPESGPWRNPCPVCGARQPPCKPECGFHPSGEDLTLPVSAVTAPEPVLDAAIEAAAKAIHAKVCDPHAGHESDDVYGFPHPRQCLTCSGQDGEPPYVEYFRRDPDDEMDLEVATAAYGVLQPLIAAEVRRACEDEFKTTMEVYQMAMAAKIRHARGAEREECARFVLSDEAVTAAANASDEWFGKDGDLKFGLSEMSKAQARVELAAVADLIRARPSCT